MTDRQLSTYKYRSEFLSMPKFIPGRLTGEDFLEFKWCHQMEPYLDHYTVAIEVLSTSGAAYYSISKLRQYVEVPPVHLGWPVRMGVLPDTNMLPSFEGDLVKGSLYIFPETTNNGIYQLAREGMLRPN